MNTISIFFEFLQMICNLDFGILQIVPFMVSKDCSLTSFFFLDGFVFVSFDWDSCLKKCFGQDPPDGHLNNPHLEKKSIDNHLLKIFVSVSI